MTNGGFETVQRFAGYRTQHFFLVLWLIERRKNNLSLYNFFNGEIGTPH